MVRDHFACVVTSPPYFWQRDYEVAGQIGLEPSIDGYVHSVCDVMDEVRGVLAPQGDLFLNLGDTYYSGKGRPQGHDRKHKGRRIRTLRTVDASGLGVPKKTLLGMPWRIALEMIGRGWILRGPIIWRRKNAIPEPNVRDDLGEPTSSYSYSPSHATTTLREDRSKRMELRMSGLLSLSRRPVASILPSFQPSWYIAVLNSGTQTADPSWSHSRGAERSFALLWNVGLQRSAST